MARCSLDRRSVGRPTVGSYASKSVDRLAISVIVPVRNARAWLPPLLAALERQRFRDFEVIVADDGSVDGGTDAIATDDGRVRVVHGPPVNVYHARNAGVVAARAPVLAFCDADCRPEPEWLEAGLAALDGADLAAGRVRFDVPASRTVWTLLDIDGTKDHERQVREGVAETANLFVRREVYERLGGFDEGQPGFGDFDFVQRAVRGGARLVYAPEAVCWHPARVDGRAYLVNAWNMSTSYARCVARAGSRPEALRLRNWVPVVQTLRGRRRRRMSVGPDRSWLAENGIEPTALERARAIPLMYLLVPYLSYVAQLGGWWAGRRERAALQRP